MSSDQASQLAAHGAFLERLARRLVADAQGAEDLVQEAYAAALAGRGNEPRDLRKWLAGAVRNLARATARGDARRRRREELVATVRQAVSPGPDEIAARLEMQEYLLVRVRALPEPYRDVVVHRFYDDRSSADIAQILGVPASTVRTRLQRALAMLRDGLDERSDGDRAAWCLALLALPRRAPAGTGAGVVASSLPVGVAIMASKKGLLIAAGVLLAAALGVTTWTAFRPDVEPPVESGDQSGVATDQFERRRAERPVPAADSEAAPDATDATTATAATTDRERDLFGVVVDESGHGIGGAHVETHFHPWRRGNILVARSDTSPGPAAETDEQGRFSLRLRRGDQVELRVSADGYAALRLVERQAGESVRVTLSRGNRLRVTVRDHRGVGVPNASVMAWRPVPEEHIRFRRRAVTDEHGECVLSGLPTGVAEVRAEHGELGRAPAVVAQIRDDAENTATLAIPQGRSVHGRVTDAVTGAPLGGARVGEGWQQSRAVSTDENGRFVLHGWSVASALQLHVTAAGHGRAQVIVPTEGELDVALAPGDSVAARVVDADGVAVAGAPVVLLATRHTNAGQEIDSLSTRTDTDGHFILDGVRRDLPHLLIVQLAGHGVLRRDVPPRAEGPGVIALGDLRLPLARSLTGRVQDADGTPVPDVIVSLLFRSTTVLKGTYGATESRRSDDLGRFSFRDLAPGSYELVAIRGGGAPARAEIEITSDADPAPALLRFAGSGTLRVRVVDRQGEPLAGVWVAADLPGFRDPPRTDSEGRARFTGLTGETISVWILPQRRPADGRRFLRQRAADLRVDGDEVLVTLVEAVSIAGRAEGPDGRPLARVFVRAFRGTDQMESTSAVTDDAGRFELWVSPGETYRVVVDGTRPVDGSPVIVEAVAIRGEERVAVPADDVVIRTERLSADRALTVRVLSADGDPVSGAEVRLQAAGGAPVESEDAPLAISDADGLARFRELPEQAVRAYASRRATTSGLADTAVRPEPLEIVPGDQTVELRFRRGTPLAGVVRTPDGKPAASASIVLFTADGTRLDRTETADDGSFRVIGLPDREHQFFANLRLPDGTELRVFAHGVRPAEDLTLELE